MDKIREDAISKTCGRLEMDEKFHRLTSASQSMAPLKSPFSEFNLDVFLMAKMMNMLSEKSDVSKKSLQVMNSLKQEARVPVMFLPNIGQDICMYDANKTVCRYSTPLKVSDGAFAHAYVFVNTPVCVGMELVYRIRRVDRHFSLTLNTNNGSLVFGLTTANPDGFETDTLDSNPAELLKRAADRWIMVDEFCDHLKENDVVAIRFNKSLSVTFEVNCSGFQQPLFRLDRRALRHKLFPFFVLLGRVQAISLITYQVKSSSGIQLSIEPSACFDVRRSHLVNDLESNFPLKGVAWSPSLPISSYNSFESARKNLKVDGVKF